MSLAKGTNTSEDCRRRWSSKLAGIITLRTCAARRTPLRAAEPIGNRWSFHWLSRVRPNASIEKSTELCHTVHLHGCAHNGLVGGSSPPGPTSLRSRSDRRLPRRSPKGKAVAAAVSYALRRICAAVLFTAIRNACALFSKPARSSDVSSG
jgi:hypothetical protein